MHSLDSERGPVFGPQKDRIITKVLPWTKGVITSPFRAIQRNLREQRMIETLAQIGEASMQTDNLPLHPLPIETYPIRNPERRYLFNLARQYIKGSQHPIHETVYRAIRAKGILDAQDLPAGIDNQGVTKLLGDVVKDSGETLVFQSLVRYKKTE